MQGSFLKQLNSKLTRSAIIQVILDTSKDSPTSHTTYTDFSIPPDVLKALNILQSADPLQVSPSHSLTSPPGPLPHPSHIYASHASSEEQPPLQHLIPVLQSDDKKFAQGSQTQGSYTYPLTHITATSSPTPQSRQQAVSFLVPELETASMVEGAVACVPSSPPGTSPNSSAVHSPRQSSPEVSAALSWDSCVLGPPPSSPPSTPPGQIASAEAVNAIPAIQKDLRVRHTFHLELCQRPSSSALAGVPDASFQQGFYQKASPGLPHCDVDCVLCLVILFGPVSRKSLLQFLYSSI